MGSQHSGFSLISQQMTFELEALKTARFNAFKAAESGNLEGLEMAVSALDDLAALEQIPKLGGKPNKFGVRMDRFKQNLQYFQAYSTYISAELGKKWALLRLKYGTQAFGVGSTKGQTPTAPAFNKPKWARKQDAAIVEAGQ